MRLKQSDRKDVHDRAVIKLTKELVAPIEKKLADLAEMLWEHHCGEASRKVLETGIDTRFYVTADEFSPSMFWHKDHRHPTTLRIRWKNTYGGYGNDNAITRSDKELPAFINMKCKLPERRPAPWRLTDLECETKEQQSLLREVFADLEAALAEIKKFSGQVDELLNSAKTLDQLKELSPALADLVDVPEPKKHLPMPVETANAVNETLNKLKTPAAA
jgi:uncharacterized coiled-coil protein SlyX